jgi:hypothetical protein
MAMIFVRALFAVLLLAVPAMANAQQAPPAPNSMRRQALESEVTRSRAIIQGGAVLPQRPAGCTSAESRQFDFWLGEWDVSPSQSPVVVAESTITLHDQGCVILENWRPFRNAHGHSINSYDAAEGRWRQTWADASGTRTEYAGSVDADGVMRLDNLSPSPSGAPRARQRMNFQRVDANAVRQWGETFDAEQRAWTTTWSFTYRRRGAQ